MGKDSSIQWCHSSCNIQMGCSGCELWNRERKICYAGIQTDGEGTRPGFAGKKGWPVAFNQPTLFLDRLEPALKWGDPTEKERDAKPWIPRTMPRLIFLNDMGDTFDSKLPLNWMAALLPRFAASRHQFLLLTKRPSRMAEFSEKHPFPDNFWLGTSITSESTIGRADHLRKVKGGSIRFLSIEPVWGFIPESVYEGIHWAIPGGESGRDPTTTNLNWIEKVVGDCWARRIPCFVKQLGARLYTLGDARPWPNGYPKDSHGGDWNEWPESLRVREFPDVQLPQASLL